MWSAGGMRGLGWQRYMLLGREPGYVYRQAVAYNVSGNQTS